MKPCGGALSEIRLETLTAYAHGASGSCDMQTWKIVLVSILHLTLNVDLTHRAKRPDIIHIRYLIALVVEMEGIGMCCIAFSS